MIVEIYEMFAHSSHDQSGSAANWKKCLMPLWATLAILGAIALAALGLGIYAAIMLANSSTAATTETATMVTSTTVSTVTNLLVVASNGAPCKTDIAVFHCSFHLLISSSECNNIQLDNQWNNCRWFNKYDWEYC